MMSIQGGFTQSGIAEQQHERLRHRLISIGFLSTAATAGPATFVSLLRIGGSGWHPVMFLHLVTGTTLVLSGLFHRRLSPRIKLWLLVGAFASVGITGLSAWGLAGLGHVLLFSMCTLLGIVADLRTSLTATVLCVVATLTVGALISGGTLTLEFDTLTYLLAFPSWLHTAVVCGLLTTITIAALNGLHGALRDSIASLEQRVSDRTAELAAANSELRKEIEARQLANTRIQQLMADLQHASRLSITGEMIAGVAHELHQPLTAIVNYATTCRLLADQGDLDSSRLEHAVENITSESLRAGQIVKGIRSFLRKDEKRIEQIDLNDIIHSAVELTTLTHGNEQIAVQLDLTPNLPPVSGDPTQLIQALTNVLLNGIEAMQNVDPDRRILSIQSSPLNDRMIQVQVTDAGCGIPEDRVSSIFDPFVTSKSAGLGIGLSISRTIVESHGGQIRLQSSDEGSTTFVIDLPFSAETPTKPEQ